MAVSALSSALLQPSREARLRGEVARLAPSSELRYVHAPIARLAVVDPALGLPQPLAQRPLREFGLVTKLAEERGNGAIVAGMLGLPGHSRTLMAYGLDTICVSRHSGGSGWLRLGARAAGTGLGPLAEPPDGDDPDPPGRHDCRHIGHQKEETMKRIVIVGCVLVLMAAAFKAGDIVRAERIVVVNHEGKPAVVALTDIHGNGELIIYAADGSELFGIRNGQFIGKLGSELRRIDRAIATTPGIAAQRTTVIRVMMLESVETLPVDGAMLKEAARLKKEAADFERKARGLESSIAQNVGDDDNSRKLRHSYRQLKLSAEQDAKRLRARASRLERQAHEQRQEVRGWDGQRTVILETTRDLGVVISKLSPGDFLTWQGTRVEMTDTTDRFTVHKIEKTPAPTNFPTHPSTRRP